MKENYTSFLLKAPYYTLNELTANTKNIWLVCHGYGQLAKFFLRKFSVLDKTENFFLFPQGLSKFYLDQHSRVGATWMTKEDRLTDIQNQYSYIDSVIFDELGADLSAYKINMFGFSQGVATICRYAAYSKLPIQKLILWGGAIPPELEKKDFDFLYHESEVNMVLGNEDQYYTVEQYEKEVARARAIMGDHIQFTVFEGGHEITPEQLLKL